MFTHSTKIRVRYGETDQMGYVYYGRYAEYFEAGRVEALRSIGISYKKLEEQGIMMPVLNLQVNYYMPLFYDEEVTVQVTIPELPTIRIKFLYKVFNAAGELTADGETTLLFVDAFTRKPIRMPAEVIAALEPHYKS
ncbi:MAG: acyl-CoA thioesterase [Sphingobacteriales bacterium JAD_PAG50586_3]|nr:MAG: acyl-CoA thioesterase [Sphingobacteriales bacterium JAD_PAG50586_3]